MKNQFKYIYLIVFSLISGTSFSMQNSAPQTPVQKKSETKLVFSAEVGGPHRTQMNAIKTLQEGDSIQLANFCLSDKAFIKELSKTKANTEIILDDSKRNLQSAKKLTSSNDKIKVFISKTIPVHCKSMMVKRARSLSLDSALQPATPKNNNSTPQAKITGQSVITQPEVAGPTISPDKIVVLGSRNLSGHAYHNIECVEKIKNNKEAYEQASSSFESLKKHCVQYGVDKSPEIKNLQESKDILPATPKQISIIDSLKYNLNKTRAARLKGSQVHIATMSLTDPEIINKIKEQAPQGTKFEIVIHNPTSEKQKQVLKDLAELDNVTTYIFNKDNTDKSGVMPKIMHEKLILRKENNLVVTSTGNGTPENDKEFNQDCYNPNYTPEKYEQLVLHFNALKSKCVVYKKEDFETANKENLENNTNVSLQAKKSVKRKLLDAFEEAAVEKSPSESKKSKIK
ncbi:hypothetical protein Noda2021_00940 [Candidatus Dependentiae bacterium Noda2021]|nr:hypothetical protein Noda2021_00940 [Candidatus Dependentiae bacterium Noda2021]